MRKSTAVLEGSGGTRRVAGDRGAPLRAGHAAATPESRRPLPMDAAPRIASVNFATAFALIYYQIKVMAVSGDFLTNLHGGLEVSWVISGPLVATYGFGRRSF